MCQVPILYKQRRCVHIRTLVLNKVITKRGGRKKNEAKVLTRTPIRTKLEEEIDTGTFEAKEVYGVTESKSKNPLWNLQNPQLMSNTYQMFQMMKILTVKLLTHVF